MDFGLAKALGPPEGGSARDFEDLDGTIVFVPVSGAASVEHATPQRLLGVVARPA